MQDQVSNLPPDPWPPRTTRIGPTLRRQAPMPAQQRCRGDHEGSPTRPRQELARRRQEHALDGRHRRTACLPSQNCELVPQYDDLQLREVVRAPTQDGELEDAAKEEVTERKEHGASGGVRCDPILRIGLTAVPLEIMPGRPDTPDPSFCTLHAILFTKEGDHIALLGLQPRQQRRPQQLERSHASTLPPVEPVPVFGQSGGRGARWPAIESHQSAFTPA